MKLSVVICTYNPVKTVFSEVLLSLHYQTLPIENWELIIIDNNSSIALKDQFDISWHPDSRVVIEKKAGLSNARITGVNAAKYPLIVFVDDDNVLDSNYLILALQFRKAYPNVGCFGGKSLPVFETNPPDWFFKTGINLGCQDHGDELYISNYKTYSFQIVAYPPKAPIGTGMVITKNAFLNYVDEIKGNPERLNLGRRGDQLTSGEDNDIILTIIKKGYEIAYVPELIVHHIIPAKRYSKEYLKKMAYESNISWIWVLNVHGIRYWKPIPAWTAGLRKVKSWIVQRAWLSPLHAIKWKSSCGMIDGQSAISHRQMNAVKLSTTSPWHHLFPFH